MTVNYLDLSFRDLGLMVDPTEYREKWIPEMRLAHLLTFLDRNRALHDQSNWVTRTDRESFDVRRDTCGTTACAAGWTVLFAGHKPDGFTTWPPVDGHVVKWTAGYVETVEGGYHYIDDTAAKLLDLIPYASGGSDDEWRREHPFNPTHTLDTLIRAAERTDVGRRMIALGLWEPRS